MICFTGSYPHSIALSTAGDSGVYDCGAPLGLVVGGWLLVVRETCSALLNSLGVGVLNEGQ